METVKEMCGDNRFEVIQRAKEHLIEATNIESSPDEMKVLDSFLFRAWQMGWLRQYEPTLKNTNDTKVGDKLVKTSERENCPMRHENGNCLPVGGFCTAVNDPICDAVHNAYENGRCSVATDTNDKWVSVDERLPITEKEAMEYYEINSEFPQFIVKIDVGVAATVLEFNGKDWFDGYATYNVTHWAPLPEPPKGLQ